MSETEELKAENKEFHADNKRLRDALEEAAGHFDDLEYRGAARKVRAALASPAQPSPEVVAEVEPDFWTQDQLREHVRRMGVEVGHDEVIPQGVRFISWPQEPLSPSEMAWAKRVIANLHLRPSVPSAQRGETMNNGEGLRAMMRRHQEERMKLLDSDLGFWELTRCAARESARFYFEPIIWIWRKITR
jgi:hypothetical protein